MLNIFSVDLKLPLMSEVGTSPNIEKLFLRLSELDDALLSTSKIITFSAKSLPKFHIPFPSNPIL